MELQIKTIQTDVLVIGGGAAGCFHALTLSENAEDVRITIVEKANIQRSGCLAAGVNALNAYITEKETPESFVEYVKKDAEGVIREDLVYSIAKRLNGVTEKIESLGLPILKDEEGKYVSRGKRSIKINGENIKPILAEAVRQRENIQILNRVNIIDYIVKEDQVLGAFGFSIEENVFYVLHAKAVVCATGGAAGVYKPNNPDFSRHKMWYSPFNTGAGYAMGIRAGAEMTSFEMRFIALRCKDTIAPTGTIAQGIKAEQINGTGERYVQKYGKPSTPMRLFSTVMENIKGNGPCYLETKGISKEQEEQLFKAYLNMAPAQTLKWVENGTGPSTENVEIDGTEPYIVGGHTASGYWIDGNRKTTLKGLYAIGDVAGGSPKKYVTGCFAEGEISALSVLQELKDIQLPSIEEKVISEKLKEVQKFFGNQNNTYTIEQVEQEMQEIMDQYAGGISTAYVYNDEGLEKAAAKIEELLQISDTLKAGDMHELLFIHEIIDRLYVSKVLIHHLHSRKETRWKCYQEYNNYPEKDDKNWKKYVNSIYKDGRIQIHFRDLVERGEQYEHSN